MSWWVRHLGVYLATNSVLVAFWVIFSDSSHSLVDVVTDLSLATEAGFWPMWPILLWGLAVALHFVFAVPSRRRRLARRDARAAALAAATPARGDRLVTVVFTDLVDSTALTETLGDKAYAELLADHRSLVRRLVAEHSGQEVNTVGDGILLSFESAHDAVDTAIAIGEALESQRASGRFTPGLRIGVHAGDVIDQDDDLVGAVLNVAARICAAAEVGEILVSEPVADKVSTRVGLVDRGLVSFKGVGQSKHLFAVERGDRVLDLGRDDAGPATADPAPDDDRSDQSP